ncbi:Ribosomal protein L19 [Spironucleus salmonicida]|uniref:Ribosomal protein L19 n=1 Tax=Spironucleus salmonicida TaxID=348837 RepID=V6LUS5_9EUKA|nr:Ribosomal protein L19 [Spironucleus salmonicida]|eukprot:EST44559.1 Ribosomal protein L19 [Spironucleus salmonicida]
MPNLTLQKRLAADILKCGKKRVLFSPQREKVIAGYTSRSAIRNLISSSMVFKAPVNAASKGRFRIRRAAKSLGRHSGHGKRRGTREARAPSKSMWIKRIRALRKMIIKFRDEKKIDATQYHELYFRIKGNQFKNKRVLLEFVINMREEKVRAVERNIQNKKLEGERQKKLVSANLITNK